MRDCRHISRFVCFGGEKETIMKKKLLRLMSKTKYFLKTNILMLTFMLTSLINTYILRAYTVKNYFDFQAILAEIGMIILFSLFAFCFKPKNRFVYFMIMAFLITGLCVTNSLYYRNYRDFASVSQLATASQLGGVANAVTDSILEVKDFVFFQQFILLIGVYIFLRRKKTYFEYATQVQKGKRIKTAMLITSVLFLGIFSLTLQGSDWSRLRKQWNREYVLGKFGLYIYQLSDIVSTVSAKFNVLWGYEKSQTAFNEFYGTQLPDITKNEYTDIFKGKNLIVIHAESIQQYLLDTYINGEPLTPNLKKLSKEGLYYSNFYAQESVGTSSDSEFTFSTSLMPASSGTVAINYWDREYVSIQKLLGNMGYYTFSMHGNNGTYWNRMNLHNSLGYDKFFNGTSDYEIDETIGLGITDKSFFRQSISKIEDISKENELFYGALIMLTNHTPFTDIENYSDYKVDFKYKVYDEESGSYVEKTSDFLEGKRLGSYFKSVHYADEAIGQFISDLDSAGLLENTVVVIYGDHDAKVKEEEYEYYYNYNPFTDETLSSSDDNYIEVSEFVYNVNRKVPFIIWSKDMPCEAEEIKTVMGMYDVLPTLGNMFGFSNEYALGTDIMNLKKGEENIVILPDGSFITDKIYFDSQNDDYFDLTNYKNVAKYASCNQVYWNFTSPIYSKDRDVNFQYDKQAYLSDAIEARINNGVVTQEYIDYYSDYADKRLTISNSIIYHNLIKATREKAEEKAEKEKKAEEASSLQNAG